MDNELETRKAILIEHGTKFQRAILNWSKDSRPIGLQGFPFGACGDTSIIFGEYLFNEGLGEFECVSGINKVGQTHAWLYQRPFTIDLTGYQFPSVREQVIVTENKHPLHQQFERHVTHQAARISIYDPNTQRELNQTLQTIRKILTTM